MKWSSDNFNCTIKNYQLLLFFELHKIKFMCSQENLLNDYVTRRMLNDYETRRMFVSCFFSILYEL